MLIESEADYGALMLKMAREEKSRKMPGGENRIVPCDVKVKKGPTPSEASNKARTKTIEHICLVRLADRDMVGVSMFAKGIGETTARVAIILKGLVHRRMVIRSVEGNTPTYSITKLGRQAADQDAKRVCAHEGCGAILGYRNKSGLCALHPPKRIPPKFCSFDGCEKKLDYKNKTGRCASHPVSNLKTCTWGGCDALLGYENKTGRCREHWTSSTSKKRAFVKEPRA